MKNLKEKDFREGLSITCKIEGTKIDDAKLHLEYGFWHVCQNIKNGLGCDNKLGYKYSWIVNDCNVTDIQIKHRTIDDLEEGDIIINNYNKRKVLGVCGKIYFISYYYGFSQVSNIIYTYTIVGLKEKGYKLVQPEEEKETILTMSEVAELVGVDVKHLKIKK